MGIVVHRGTADTGHYYSYIRERMPKGGGAGAERKWYQFNDTLVEVALPLNADLT